MDLTRNLPAFERSASTNCAKLLDIPNSAAAILVGFPGLQYVTALTAPMFRGLCTRSQRPRFFSTTMTTLFVLLVSLPIVLGEKAHRVPKGVESSLYVYTTISVCPLNRTVSISAIQ